MRAVVQRPNDPYIYLWVKGEWYCYNPMEEPLGSGAMGDVYLGYRCRTGELIAVKRVKDFYANNRLIRERARQEASLAFRHPNLVEMVGYCEYAPDVGPIFILSHYVQGEDSDVYVRRFDQSLGKVEKVCTLARFVLEALGFVHAHGVVHRDVKPSNIMVENGMNVRLMDLGIARMNGGNKFSSFGFIGTPEYAAPEQLLRGANGEEAHIDATTDIYALGLTLYELLTGKNPMACSSEAETLTRQMKMKLPDNRCIPKQLMQVIWKATEKDQAKRYQSAQDFNRAIQEALQPEPSLFQKIKNKLWS